MRYKLGKKPARAGAIEFRLDKYLNAAALPPLPKTWGHEGLISDSEWGMLGNDRVGDCVFAGAAHEVMLLNKANHRDVAFTDHNVLLDYSGLTGYDPNDPSTDQGTDVQEAAAYRQRVGILDSNGERHKIAAYLALEPGNVQHLYYASYLFGAVGIGVQLPDSAETQFEHEVPWDVVSRASIVGGHYVPLVGRNSKGFLVIVTWGRVQAMSETFLRRYCDEAVAYVSMEYLLNERSPEGFDYSTLAADLTALG